MNKFDLVLQHLCKHGFITSLEAIRLYGATRLSDIIYKLRKRGLIINSNYQSGYDRFNNKIHYVQYELVDSATDLSFLENKKSPMLETLNS